MSQSVALSANDRMDCAVCEHCNTDEATKLVAGPGAAAHHVAAGICTLRLGWFNGKHVPDWLTNCPDFERAERAQ